LTRTSNGVLPELKRADGWCKSDGIIMNSPWSCRCESLVMSAVYRVKDKWSEWLVH